MVRFVLFYFIFFLQESICTKQKRGDSWRASNFAIPDSSVWICHLYILSVIQFVCINQIYVINMINNFSLNFVGKLIKISSLAPCLHLLEICLDWCFCKYWNSLFLIFSDLIFGLGCKFFILCVLCNGVLYFCVQVIFPQWLLGACPQGAGKP